MSPPEDNSQFHYGMNRKPKICFFLQRSYAFTGHALAVWLQEKYGVTEFCSYTGVRRMHEFLKSQKDILYTELLLDEDVHNRYKNEKLDLSYLRALEKEYGIPNLWPYLTVDREIMSNQAAREYPYNTPRYTHDEMLRILQVTAKAVIDFLDREKPDVAVFSVIGAVPSLLLYHIAKKRGIRIAHILTVSLKDRFAVSERYDVFTDAEKIFAQNLANNRKGRYYDEAKKVVRHFRETPHPYDPKRSAAGQPIHRGKQLRFLWPTNFLRSLRWFVKMLYLYMTGNAREDYTTVSPWNYAKDHTKRKLRNLVGVSDLYDTYLPNEPHAFFALGYEPEMSLSLLAPFADQLYLIRQTARSLPVGWKLYVKEHPEMVPYRPRSYYKELKKIPNVRLMSPSIDGSTLAANANLIVTVTGSAAWEGVLLGKPSIVFGNRFFNILSMVKKCAEIENLPYPVKEQIEDFHYNEEELLQFIAAILEDSASLKFIELWEQEYDSVKKKEGLEPLADLIAKKIGLAATSAS